MVNRYRKKMDIKKYKQEYEKMFGLELNLQPNNEMIKFYCKEAQKEEKKRILSLPCMKRGKFDGNKWYKQLCMEIEDNKQLLYKEVR